MSGKYIFLFGLFLISSNTIKSQNATKISGIVKDVHANIEFATVVVYPSDDSTKVLFGNITDSLGRFELTDLTFGDYILEIRMLGFETYRTKVILNRDKPTQRFDTIQLLPDSRILDGVTIVSHKDLIKKTALGFIVKAKDNLTQAAGTATDLLKNTPTVVVDAEGAITIRSKAPLILINGRNSALASTDKIPASSVESIEIIYNPTAKYDANADGGIINIILKKNIADGLNGSVAMGGGFGAKGRVSSSTILNFKKGAWNLGLAYDNRFSGRTRKRQANRIDFDIPEAYYLNQHRFDDRLEQSQNIKLNLDFQADAKNSFSFEAIGNYGKDDNDESLYSLFKSQDNNFRSNNFRFSKERAREKVGEFALNYKRKFKNESKYLLVNLSTSYDLDRENTDITTQSLYVDDTPFGLPLLQRTYNYQNSNVSNIKFDFGQAVTKNSSIDLGYKAILRYTDADFQSQYFTNNEYIKNPKASNIFNFKEQVHAAYCQYNGHLGMEDSIKWKYNIGLRGEYVSNEGIGLNNDVSVSRKYFNFFPSANLTYHINTSDNVTLSAGRRINRPKLEDLNPFIDITDSLNQHGGNPYLRPELIQTFELGYNKEWQKISMSTIIFYRSATNIIRPFIALDSTGIALSQPMNFGNGTTYGVEEIASIFPLKWWNANVSISCYQQKISGANVSSEIANNFFSWYGKIINNITLWKESQLQIMGNYTSSVGTPQGFRNAISYIDVGFRQKVMKQKGALGLVITDVFNTQNSGYTATADNYTYTRYFKVDTRAVMLTFAYTFNTTFKEDMLENKFNND